MLVDYNSLSDTSKIYIFPSNRKFYAEEFPEVLRRTEDFLQDFKGMDSFFEIKYRRFLVLLISDLTPLSIEQNDVLVSYIQSLEKEFKISLLDRVNVCFKQGEYVQMKEIPEFKKLIKNKGVSKNTVVFDNLISRKQEYDCCWESKAGESWISHLF